MPDLTDPPAVADSEPLESSIPLLSFSPAYPPADADSGMLEVGSPPADADSWPPALWNSPPTLIL